MPCFRLSVCPSVTFRYRVQIRWNSSKIISRPNSLRLVLVDAQHWRSVNKHRAVKTRPKISDPYTSHLGFCSMMEETRTACTGPEKRADCSDFFHKVHQLTLLRREETRKPNAKLSARQPWYRPIGRNSLNRPSLRNAQQHQRRLI